MSSHADTIRRGIGAAPSYYEWRSEAVVALDALLAENQQLRDALESVEVFYPEALELIRELAADAKSIYEPEKGWPPHIAAAENLGDHEDTMAAVREALAGDAE